MRMRSCFLAILAVCVFALPVHATSAYKAAFEQAYPAAVGTRIDACTLCHVAPPVRNSYGAALKSANFDFKAIEAADSDGDGFTNLQEITALTFPGNGADNPNATSNTQPGGCAGLSCQKGDFSPGSLAKVLGDLFVTGLSLAVLQLLARRKF